ALEVSPGSLQVTLPMSDGPQVVRAVRRRQGAGSQPVLNGERAPVVRLRQREVPPAVRHRPEIAQDLSDTKRIGSQLLPNGERALEVLSCPVQLALIRRHGAQTGEAVALSQ